MIESSLMSIESNPNQPRPIDRTQDLRVITTWQAIIGTMNDLASHTNSPYSNELKAAIEATPDIQEDTSTQLSSTND